MQLPADEPDRHGAPEDRSSAAYTPGNKGRPGYKADYPQFSGAGDKEGVKHTFRIKLIIASSILITATLILLVFPKELIGLYLSKNSSLNDTVDTLGFATNYLYIMILGLLPFAISQIYGSTLRELGETKLPMFASVIAIFINVIFNYILIFGNEGLRFLPFAPMGVVGAAIATTLSRYVEMAIILLSVHLKPKHYDFIIDIYRSFKIPLNLCKKVFKKGFPLLINEFLWSFGMAALMQCYSVRGIEVVAATNISSTVANIFNVIYISMGTAIAIMVGQQLGANQPKKAKTTVWRLLTFSAVACVITALLLFAVSSLIPAAYNTTETVQELASKLLWIVAIAMPFNAVCHGSYFAMRSGGKTIVTLLFDSGFIWVVSYTVAFYIAHFTNLSILPFFFIIQSIEAFKSIIAVILIKSGFWLNNIVE